jgi:thiamine-phosphate pyrophosphorylase
MTQIYLISPKKISLPEFSKKLENALKTNLVPVFQLRLKDCDLKEVTKSAKELKKICHDNNCLFILNDSYQIALEIQADGVHLGGEDGNIKLVRKQADTNNKTNKPFIIGASCYDSRHLAMEAGEKGADYLSFGTFFLSKTKNSQGKPTIEILQWCNELINLPVVAIGGITDQNCSSLVKAGADFIAVISYVWQHPLGEAKAIENLNKAINQAN